MKSMILAAGFGARLRPLTETTPKPLLKVGGKPLLQYHLQRLAAAGITELVINTSWLAQQIEDYFGDGSDFGVSIDWSREAQPLETGGGIANALPLLGSEPFLLINGDVWTDFPLQSISLDQDADAHLVMVANPEHNPSGDFAVADNLVSYGAGPKYTFSGISVFRPQLFADVRQDCFPLRDVMRPAILSGRVTGSVYNGQWWDIGTVERLTQLDNNLNKAEPK
ncbi:MAG: nucleotidyltransferase family protein [Porticoccaceae bacterium]|jgi:MurNAc alpha-1-phosphate uridylyltransferase|nr:nucleotidyltransferase family protein [Porticoccaceae bacterium]